MLKVKAILVFSILLNPILTLAEELILEYKFTSDTGKIVLDTSDNDLEGQIQGSGTNHFGIGFSGKGLRLNGVDNFVLVQDNPLFDLDQYTLMAWIKFKPNNWDREEVMEKAGAFWMNIRQATRKVRVGGFYGGCGGSTFYYKFDSNGTVPIDKWTHVAATYDGSTLRIFINGVLSGRSPVPVPGPVCINTEPLSIGSKHRTIKPTEDAAFFFGMMDSVKIFSGALPAWRINQEMDNNKYLLYK